MGGEGGGIVPLLLLVGLFVVWYFFLIRPNQQRRRQLVQMQESLTPGAEVITTSGLYGTVVDLGPDSVTLEVAPGVTNRYVRAAIGRISAPEAGPAGPDGDSRPAVDRLDDAPREPGRPEDPAGR